LFFVVKFDSADWRLYMSFHHIIADDVSMYNILLPEVAEYYSAMTKSGCNTEPKLMQPLALQYADYTVFERQR
jgi:hypothetical protein